MANSIWLNFADGEYLFHLKSKRISEVEEACKAGLGEIFARTYKGVLDYTDDDGLPAVYAYEAGWKTNELATVFKQAMIGGGKCVVDGEEKDVGEYRANQLIQNYLENEPLEKLWQLAAAILGATFKGYETPKKAEPVEQPANQE